MKEIASAKSNYRLLRNIALTICLLLSHFKSQCQSLETRWLISINKNEKPALDEALRGLSGSVIYVAAATPVTMFSVGYFRNDPRWKKASLGAAGGILMAMTLSTIIKYSVHRTRPYAEYPGEIVQRDAPSTYSFPSGHTTAAFSTAAGWCFHFPKWYVIAPASLYAGSVAYARMRLGVHYPSDVLAGMILGTGSAWLSWKIEKWFFAKRKTVTPEG